MSRSVERNSVRVQQALKLLWLARDTYPARLARRLAKEEARLQMDFDAAPDPKTRLAVSDGLAAIRNQMLDIIGHPRRPPAGQKRRMGYLGAGPELPAIAEVVGEDSDSATAEAEGGGNRG